MPPVIETARLTKFYGPHAGLQELDLSVDAGEVFGLLGPNGAGKTTTIRLLLDFIKPTTGTAQVFGLDTRSSSLQIRARTGYLPGDFISYPNLTAGEVLDYFTNLRGGDRQADRDELCERFKLDQSRKFGELSRGNRQKVGLVQAYMGDPELIVLDEPSGGLDPLLQIEFQQLVRERQQRGRTQFISSHLLPEVEAVCDRVGIIREGRLVALETVSEIRARAQSKITVGVAEDEVENAAKAFSEIEGCEVTAAEGTLITLRYTGDIDPVIKAAAQFTVASLESHPPALDEVFMAYYSGDAVQDDRARAAAE